MNQFNESEELIAYIMKNKNIVIKEYMEKELVAIEGDRITHIGFVLSGQLRLLNYTYDGYEYEHDKFSKNYIIPIYQYLAGRSLYEYTLESSNKSKIAWIPTKEFDKELKSNSDIMYKLIIHLSERAYKSEIRIRCYSYKKVRERLAFWIVKIKEANYGKVVKLPRNQTIWARELMVNRSSLNLEINNMINDELIEISNNKLIVKNLDKLKQIY